MLRDLLVDIWMENSGRVFDLTRAVLVRSLMAQVDILLVHRAVIIVKIDQINCPLR